MSTNQTSSSNQLPSMGQHQIYHQMGQQTATNNLDNFSPKHFNNSSNTNSNNSNNKVSSSSQVRIDLTADRNCWTRTKYFAGFTDPRKQQSSLHATVESHTNRYKPSTSSAAFAVASSKLPKQSNHRWKNDELPKRQHGITRKPLLVAGEFI